MEWCTLASGGRCPLDPGVLEREPQPRDVVLYVPANRGIVVSGDAIAGGDVDRWMGANGTELRASHWESCLGAATHRGGGVNDNQERLEL